MHIYGRGIREYVFVTAVKNGGTLFTCGHENQFLPFLRILSRKHRKSPERVPEPATASRRPFYVRGADLRL